MASLTCVVVGWLLGYLGPPLLASCSLTGYNRPVKCWFQVSRCSKGASTSTFKPLLCIRFANVSLGRSRGQTQFKGWRNRISFLMRGSALPQGRERFDAVFTICYRTLGCCEGCRLGRREERGVQKGTRLLQNFSWGCP